MAYCGVAVACNRKPPHRMQADQVIMSTSMRCRLYLATKIANPHYKPEIAAQTTLVNFCVTEEGMEEQLLASVVDHERPDLQHAAAALVTQLAEYTITVTNLEDNLLSRLSNSQVLLSTILTLGVGVSQ